MSDGANQTTASAHIRDDVPPGLPALALGSVGVVYGDIGTSPLYAFREAAIAASGDQVVSRGVVLGVLSLILWALIITVTLKYVLILLRADNNGEGGTLSLTALATRALGRRTAFVFIVGVIGASMFLGELGDYAGDFGAFSSGGAQTRKPYFQRVRCAAHGHHSDRLIRCAEPRYRQGGGDVRTYNGCLVSVHCDRRRTAHS